MQQKQKEHMRYEKKPVRKRIRDLKFGVGIEKKNSVGRETEEALYHGFYSKLHFILFYFIFPPHLYL